MLRTFSFVEVHEQGNFNTETVKAIEESKKGIGITKTKNHTDLMKKLRS
jgi:antitoxin component of RelBE/YafQ-DinJ toxin-antitoxin module